MGVPGLQRTGGGVAAEGRAEGPRGLAFALTVQFAKKCTFLTEELACGVHGGSRLRACSAQTSGVLRSLVPEVGPVL